MEKPPVKESLPEFLDLWKFSTGLQGKSGKKGVAISSYLWYHTKGVMFPTAGHTHREHGKAVVHLDASGTVQTLE